jgi:hypothetical protein
MQSLLVTMTQLRKLTLLVVLPFALLLAACGSGGSSSSSVATTSSATPQPRAASAPRSGGERKPDSGATGSKPPQSGRSEAPPTPEPAFEPRPHHDSGGGSKQFEAKGGDNSIEEYGSETSGSEFDEAARAFHDFLDARAAGAWAAACKRMASAVTEGLIRQLGSAEGGGKPTCATVLADLSTGVPRAALREEADQADVAALRVEGDRGFLLFRGVEGEAFFVPMLREDGQWKVAAIAPSALL